jgi:hypothetical protein
MKKKLKEIHEIMEWLDDESYSVGFSKYTIHSDFSGMFTHSILKKKKTKVIEHNFESFDELLEILKNIKNKI